MGGDEFSYSTSYSRTCNELQNIAPEDRTEKQHEEVANWFRVHCTKFVYSLSNNPQERDKHLLNIVRVARLFDAKPGQLICMQNETCDNLFIVYSGSVDIYFNASGRVRGRQIIAGRGEQVGDSETIVPLHKTTTTTARKSSTMLDETYDQEHGSLFTQFHVGDFFGEPDVGSNNTNYPFTAKAELNHQVEADVLMKQATMNKGSQRRTVREPSSEKDTSFVEKFKHSIEEFGIPRIIAIPVSACTYLNESSRDIHLWQCAKLLRQSHYFCKWSLNSLYLMAMKSEEKIYSNNAVICEGNSRINESFNFILDGKAEFCIKNDSSKQPSSGQQPDSSQSNIRTIVMQLGVLSIFGDFRACLRECEKAIVRQGTGTGSFSSSGKVSLSPMSSRRTIIPPMNSSGNTSELDPDALNSALRDVSEDTASNGEPNHNSIVGTKRGTFKKKQSSRRVTGLISKSPVQSRRNVFARANSSRRDMGEDSGHCYSKSNSVSPVMGGGSSLERSDDGSISPKTSSRNLLSNFRTMQQGKLNWLSEVIEKENALIKVRNRGGDGGRSGGEDLEKRVVFSNYHVVSHGMTKILSIPKDVIANVCTYNSPTTVGLTFSEMAARVRQHSSWCGTQEHLLLQQNAQVATGRNLLLQQSSFIACDRCNQIRCYTEKDSCKRQQKNSESQLESIKSSLLCNQGSGNDRVLQLTPSAGEDVKALRKSMVGRKTLNEAILEQAEEKNDEKRKAAQAEERQKKIVEQNKRVRRNSIENLLSMFKRGNKKRNQGENNKGNMLQKEPSATKILAEVKRHAREKGEGRRKKEEDERNAGKDEKNGQVLRNSNGGDGEGEKSKRRRRNSISDLGNKLFAMLK